MQPPGQTQTTTMDFWVPKINAISVHINANSGTTGGGGTTRGGGTNPTPRPPAGGNP
jgi:hypothetical protein